MLAIVVMQRVAAPQQPFQQGMKTSQSARQPSDLPSRPPGAPRSAPRCPLSSRARRSDHLEQPGGSSVSGPSPAYSLPLVSDPVRCTRTCTLGGANALHRPTQEWSHLRSHEAQAEDESAYGTPREGGATNQSFQPLERATVAEGSAINPLDSP